VVCGFGREQFWFVRGPVCTFALQFSAPFPPTPHGVVSTLFHSLPQNELGFVQILYTSLLSGRQAMQQRCCLTLVMSQFSYSCAKSSAERHGFTASITMLCFCYLTVHDYFCPVDRCLIRPFHI